MSGASTNCAERGVPVQRQRSAQMLLPDATYIRAWFSHSCFSRIVAVQFSKCNSLANSVLYNPLISGIVTVNWNIVTMTSWMPALTQDGPRYMAIADAIAADLASGGSQGRRPAASAARTRMAARGDTWHRDAGLPGSRAARAAQRGSGSRQLSARPQPARISLPCWRQSRACCRCTSLPRRGCIRSATSTLRSTG